MRLEPFNLIGKTVKDCFLTGDNKILKIEFTDNTIVVIETLWTEDEISGDLVNLEELMINTMI